MSCKRSSGDSACTHSMPEPAPHPGAEAPPDPEHVAVDIVADEDESAPSPQPAPRANTRWIGLPDVRARLERVMPRPLAALAELLLITALALGLAEGVQAAVVKPFRIPSASMEPTLAIGQRVLVNRIIYRLHKPARGDIIVFHPPTSLTCGVVISAGEPCPQNDGHEDSTYFIKRVVGLPGERLSVRDGHPVINGREITNEPYITPCGGAQGCTLPQSIVIPPNTVYVMGDNRGNSDDSRFWGPVPDSWIVGEAFLTYWPPDRIGTP